MKSKKLEINEQILSKKNLGDIRGGKDRKRIRSEDGCKYKEIS